MKKIISSFIFILVIIPNLATAAVWTEPASGPPDGNIAAPLNTSGESQTKSGGLGLLGAFSTLVSIMVGTNSDGPSCDSETDPLCPFTPSMGTGGQLKLDVEGNIGAQKYCDNDGNNCKTMTEMIAGMTNHWTKSGVNLYQSVLSDNLGLGTNAPAARLHVSGPNFPVARIERTTTAQGGIYAGDYVVRSNTSGLTNGAGVARYFGLADSTGVVRYTGSFGVRWVNAASKTMLMTFNTANGGSDPTSGTERMVIDGSGNVGIGTTGPTQKLEINGGLRLNTTTAKPGCSSSVRGLTWFTQGAAGVKDNFEVCAKDAAGAYAWRTLY